MAPLAEFDVRPSAAGGWPLRIEEDSSKGDDTYRLGPRALLEKRTMHSDFVFSKLRYTVISNIFVNVCDSLYTHDYS